MEFVVAVLVRIFHKPAAEAAQIMLDVHRKGKGIVGLYPLDIARTKVVQVEQMAGQAGFPLMASIEE
jgi:ATP-dependent Clp protease adaptor protein ClpS